MQTCTAHPQGGSNPAITGKLKTDHAGLILIWLESAGLFQTFSELDEVKDKLEEIRLIRQLIDEDVTTEPEDEETVC